MTTVNIQQVLTQAVVGAMTVSIMASAMGIMMGTMTASTLAAPVSELKGTQAAVRELKLAFGGNIVDQAVKNVGTDSMLALAVEVERLVIADMYTQYGKTATDTALKAAVPGDVVSAREIAASLAGRGYGKSVFSAPSTPTREVPPPVVEKAVEIAKKRVKMKAKPVLDTKTGVQYKSKASAGMTVAAEYGLDPSNTFIWYEVIKKDPTRFKEIGALSPAAEVSSASAYAPPKGSSLAAAQVGLVSRAAVTEEAKPLSFQEAMKKYEEEEPSMTWTTSGKQAMVDRVLPEWKQIINDMSSMNIPGNKLLKPKKFVEKIKIFSTPSSFNPSSQGDYAFTHSYTWDGINLAVGPSYSYDTMMNVVGSPYERTVDVPKGSRVWICTYDGQWGGYWSRVEVFVHPDDISAKPGLKLLYEGKMHKEE